MNEERLKPTWHQWSEERPPEPGTYLTYWSDDTIETFPLDEEDIEEEFITCCNEILLYWAHNVERPELS